MASLAPNIRNDRANVINNALTSGGHIEVYDGSSNILYSFNWTGSVMQLSNATLSFNNPDATSTIAANTGTTNNATLFDNTSNPIISNLSVGTNYSNDVIVNTTNIISGRAVDWTYGAIHEGNA